MSSMIRLVSWIAVPFAMVTACAGGGARSGPGAVPAPPSAPSVHVATWDPELKAVVAALVMVEGEDARLTVGSAGPRSLRVVSVDAASPEDAAVVEAGDTCVALRGSVVCNAGALSWLDGDHGLQVDPALLFLVAHELDHVRHGEDGQFSMPLVTVDAGLNIQDTVLAFQKRVCDPKDPIELRADDFARGVVGRAVAAGIFSTDLGLGAVSAVLALFAVGAERSLGGDARTAALLDDAPPQVDANHVSVVTDLLLCPIAPPLAEPVRWVGFPGGYQTERLRLVRAADELADELLHGEYGVAAHAGNLPDLFRTMVGISRAIAVQHANFIEAVAAEMCARTSEPDPWSGLECDADPAAFRPALTCPSLETEAGLATTASLGKGPARPARVDGADLYLPHAVTAAAIRADGSVVVAVGDDGLLVSWSPRSAPAALGEVGCAVAGLAEDGDGLVAVCAHAEAAVRIRAGARMTTPLGPVRTDGDVLPRDGVVVVWAGVVAGRTLAALRLIGSGRGVLTELTPAGLRNVGAWADGDCNTLPTVRVTSAGGQVWATTARHDMAALVVLLDDALARVIERIEPDPTTIVRCYLGVGGEPRCLDVHGAIVAARGPGDGVRARLPLAETGIDLDGAVVQACSAGSADYVLIATSNGAAHLFEWHPKAARAELRWQAVSRGPVDRAELVCHGGAAAAVVVAGDGSVVGVVRAP